jgi:pectin methylesterase-like acyl-CoA thioesterase
MKHKLISLTILIFASVVLYAQEPVGLFPQNNAQNVNPDTHLVLTFATPPKLGKSGKIRIYEASGMRLVDSLDLSIPAGPTVKDTTRVPYTAVPYEYNPGHYTNANTKPGTPSGEAVPNNDKYQLNIIGGFTDAFHFYPVIIHDKLACIYLHNNLLEYGKTYLVTIDKDVFVNNSFKGIDKDNWRFATKAQAPDSRKNILTVSADGEADFNTVQGAIDFIPEENIKPYTIRIKNGTYEEIIYFRHKSNIRFIGEDRDKTVIYYNNCEIFNPHPSNLGTNELPGTFPSRRATFAADNCNDLYFSNLSLSNSSVHQAEGLLLTGERNILYKVNVTGGGDAFQVNGTAYIKESKIEGKGDMILGRGAAFFDHCELYCPRPLVWVRNTSANHGDVFVDCKLYGTGKEPTVLARSPENKGKTYPYCEAVLINCTLSGITPEAWGPIDGKTENIHYWEYNSKNPDGSAVDTTKRHPASKQLNVKKDAKIIADYRTPSYILNGWTPVLDK